VASGTDVDISPTGICVPRPETDVSKDEVCGSTMLGKCVSKDEVCGSTMLGKCVVKLELLHVNRLHLTGRDKM
jgi:hypothetical protein